MVPGDTLNAKYMPHNDDTIDFLETSGLLRGYPSDLPPPYPAGGLNQKTPDSPLWTQLAFTKAHQAPWRQPVAHNPLPLSGSHSRFVNTPKQALCIFFWEWNQPVLGSFRDILRLFFRFSLPDRLLMSKASNVKLEEDKAWHGTIAWSQSDYNNHLRLMVVIAESAGRELKWIAWAPYQSHACCQRLGLVFAWGSEVTLPLDSLMRILELLESDDKESLTVQGSSGGELGSPQWEGSSRKWTFFTW